MSILNKSNMKYIILLLFITSVGLITPAFAQESIPPLVDGIKTTWLIAGIAIIGITLQTYKGMIGKKKSEFSFNQLIFTGIVGIGAAIILVGNAFQNISTDLNETELLIFMVQQILTIIGAKTITDIGKKHRDRQNNIIDETTEPKPIDDPDDLPPGKLEYTPTSESGKTT